MLNLLIGPIADLAGTWLNGKVEKSKAETGAKVARAKAEATITAGAEATTEAAANKLELKLRLDLK